MSVTREGALAATLGRERGRLPPELVVRTDTRSLRPGETFLALRGPNFDGHAFVRRALASGAGAVVVEAATSLPDGAPALVVGDTHAAFLALARAARSSSSARFVAITGSTGKTTTKDLLAQLLVRATGLPVAATPANENNEIGVAKLLLSLDPAARYAVVEMGARHYGEIVPLAEIVRPAVAVLTNIGEAHLEIMGSAARLAETKWGIFATGATPVLGLADAVSRARGAADPQVRWFGVDAAATPLASAWRTIVRGRERLEIAGPEGAQSWPIDVRVAGDHNRQNLAAALAAALALGAEAGALAAAIPSLALPHGRYERIAAGPLFLVYDAYNASASGTVATLASFAAEPATRRIAVLGSMAELGPEAAELHERTGAAAASVDVLLALGPHASDLARGARAAGLAAECIVEPEGNDAAAAWLRRHGRAGDLVLLKASRRYGFEEIVAALGAPLEAPRG